MIILPNYTCLPPFPLTLTLVPSFSKARVCAGSASGHPVLPMAVDRAL